MSERSFLTFDNASFATKSLDLERRFYPELAAELRANTRHLSTLLLEYTIHHAIS